ncbi:MAG: M20/M25/M40 family metallo-hydrolase, partial [Thiotrichales bacterium]|nr:M20/M25/M40 family metallo-hydrolase [Thiotrichales bacterium]
MNKVPDMLDGFAQLVALPSVSSVDPAYDMSNRPVVDCLANWLDNLGFAIDLMPVPGAPGSEHEKYNLIASMGEGNSGLVIAGHTDTVPYDESTWKTDPFVLTERDGRLYGLGASDMKCL